MKKFRMRKWEKCRLEFLAVIKLDSVLLLLFFSLVDRYYLCKSQFFFLRCLVMTFECGFDTQKEKKNSSLLTHFRLSIMTIFWISSCYFFFLKIIQSKMLKVVHFCCYILIRVGCKRMKLCKFTHLNLVLVLVLVHVCVNTISIIFK